MMQLQLIQLYSNEIHTGLLFATSFANTAERTTVECLEYEGIRIRYTSAATDRSKNATSSCSTAHRPHFHAYHPGEKGEHDDQQCHIMPGL